MCNPMFLAAGATAMKGIGDYSAGMSSAKQASANAAELDRAAGDTAVRGGIAALSTKTQGQTLKGQQTAAVAANGVDMASGTGSDILAKTAADTEFDAMTVQNNAMREAYGLQVQAIGQRAKAKADKMNARIGLAGSLLGSGAQAWGGYKAMGSGGSAAASSGRMVDGGRAQANQFRGYA